MFSNTKAPKALLIIPLLLLVVVGLLGYLTIQTLTTNTTANGGSTNTTSSSGQQTQSASSSSQSATSDANKEALNKPPKSNYPDNTCPAILVTENNANKFAVDNGEKYSLSPSQASWIQANCPDLEVLNF